MICLQAYVRAAMLAAATTLLVPSLAYPQPPFYQGDGADADSSVQEQMTPAPERPRKSTVRAAKPKLRPRASAASIQNKAAVQPAETCSGSPDVLGTSRIMSIGAPNGLEVGLKTYPQTLKLEDHEVILTFDDGPLPETTGKVLDALKAQCVRATFFLIGQNAAANPQFVRRQIREGHT